MSITPNVMLSPVASHSSRTRRGAKPHGGTPAREYQYATSRASRRACHLRPSNPDLRRTSRTHPLPCHHKSWRAASPGTCPAMVSGNSEVTRTEEASIARRVSRAW
eukprot:scaffold250031_cov49-Tisochrysis_lutea.AAC.2